MEVRRSSSGYIAKSARAMMGTTAMDRSSHHSISNKRWKRTRLGTRRCRTMMSWRYSSASQSTYLPTKFLIRVLRRGLARSSGELTWSKMSSFRSHRVNYWANTLQMALKQWHQSRRKRRIISLVLCNNSRVRHLDLLQPYSRALVSQRKISTRSAQPQALTTKPRQYAQS